jgi:hypothetical protein
MGQDAIEETRARFRPERITTLFVGESAPASGDFFYFGGNALLAHMQAGIEGELGRTDDFLTTFKGYGWFLDDLVLTPVNQMKSAERKMACRDAEASLAARIARYRPLAIVSLLKTIERNVERAAIAAKSTAPRYVVPFPGMGQQSRFRAAMEILIPTLPRKK